MAKKDIRYEICLMLSALVTNNKKRSADYIFGRLQLLIMKKIAKAFSDEEAESNLLVLKYLIENENGLIEYIKTVKEKQKISK